jgi:hypothetical protein
MRKQYCVTLTEEERQGLRKLVSAGKAAARKLLRARILLLADQGGGGLAKTDAEIAESLCCGRATVERVRKQFVDMGLEATLRPMPSTRRYERRLNDDVEAHLIALLSGEPPSGRPRWSLRLLTSRMIDLGYVESVSHETVRRMLNRRRGSA